MPGRPAVLYCRWGSASSLDSCWRFVAALGFAVGCVSLSGDDDESLILALQGSTSLLSEAVGAVTVLESELSSWEELSSSRLGWCFAPFSTCG